MKTLFDDEPRFASCPQGIYKFDGHRIYRASQSAEAWIPVCNYSQDEFENLIRRRGVQEVYEDPIRR